MLDSFIHISSKTPLCKFILCMLSILKSFNNKIIKIFLPSYEGKNILIILLFYYLNLKKDVISRCPVLRLSSFLKISFNIELVSISVKSYICDIGFNSCLST